MFRATITVVLAVVGVAIATPSRAQHGLSVRVTPRAGVLTPPDWFYDEFAHFGAGDTEWTEAAILRSEVAGVTAELEVGNSGIWVRAEVLRTIGAETDVIHAVLIPVSGYDPARVERTPYRVPTAITFGSVDLALPTRFTLPFRLQPYVTAGIAGKRYDFDTGPLTDIPSTVVLPHDGTTLAANVGAGVVRDFGPVGFDLLVRDAVSKYWSDIQHDVVFLGGLRFRLFDLGL